MSWLRMPAHKILVKTILVHYENKIFSFFFHKKICCKGAWTSYMAVLDFRSGSMEIGPCEEWEQCEVGRSRIDSSCSSLQ